MNMYEKLSAIEAEIDNLKCIVSIGEVTTVNSTDGTVKVALADDSESGYMPVLSRGDSWIPEVGDVCVLLIRPAGDGIVIGKCV